VDEFERFGGPLSGWQKGFIWHLSLGTSWADMILFWGINTRKILDEFICASHNLIRGVRHALVQDFIVHLIYSLYGVLMSTDTEEGLHCINGMSSPSWVEVQEHSLVFSNIEITLDVPTVNIPDCKN